MGDFFQGYEKIPIKPRITIVKTECGDWIGLYINGKIEKQHHSIDENDWIELIEKYGTFLQDVLVYWVSDEYGEEYGQFPDNFKDIPKGAFI